MQNPFNKQRLSNSAFTAAAFRGGRIFIAVFVLLACSAHVQTSIPLASKLRATRTSPLDLEISGDLVNFPPNTTRYLARNDLLSLPQLSYTVSDDANFTGPTRIIGVSLEELTRQLAANPNNDLVVAICGDKYRSNYSRDYIAAHHPVLVLNINGQPPSGWPKDSEGHNFDMGPYLISHPTSSFKIASNSDEPQIPWGVVRLEFRNETTVFGAIAPRGPQANDAQVQAGYRIAQQNCFRCHNMGDEGGQKAGRPWLVLSTWATASPEYFAAYVHDPKEKNPKAQMPGFPEYDEAALRALTAYFQTFTERGKP